MIPWVVGSSPALGSLLSSESAWKILIPKKKKKIFKKNKIKSIDG